MFRTPPLPIPQTLEMAIQRHQAGQLAEAEALYRQILAIQPNHVDALQLLGVVAHQCGRHDLAIDLIGRALTVNPQYPAAYSNLGEAYRSLGRVDDALNAYRRAIQLRPDFAEAHRNLATTLTECGHRDEAIAAYRALLRIQPQNAEGHMQLGNLLTEQRRLEEAIGAYRRAIEIKPLYVEAHNNLGNVFRECHRLDEAIAAYRRAAELRPTAHELHNNLGLTLMEKCAFAEAEITFRRVLELQGDFPEAHNNLGLALVEQRKLDEAMAAFRRALQLRHDYAIAQSNLGSVLRERGLHPEAIAAGRRAVELDPRSGEALNNLATALAESGQQEEAVTAFRRALQLKPDSAMAHNNLGNALKDLGRIGEAIVELRRAVQLAPELAWVHSNLIYSLHFDPHQDDCLIAQEQERWNRRFAEPRKPFLPPDSNDPSPERRLRIGYVSAEYYDHVVGRNLLPLLEGHDRSQFEIFCYSAVVNPDHFTEKIKQRAGHWRSTVGESDQGLVEIIRRDGIDILVDLSQHMAANRLPLFAHQPAPVQFSFAGYPAGTGLESIHYRISDRHLESEISDLRSAEQVLLLDSFWCYDPSGMEVEVNALPALDGGRITFGSLNNFCKINEGVLKVWGRVLTGVAESRLILLSPAGSHRQRILEVLSREGVDAARIEFVERLPRRAYLELHHRVDIALDPFPYNGHTTSLDALTMGVPVVTMVGDRTVSRAGFSQLSNLGLAELAAFSEDEYVAIATELAGNLSRLAQLRSSLRARMQASVLMNSAHFARSIECAYRAVWRQFCANKR